MSLFNRKNEPTVPASQSVSPPVVSDQPVSPPAVSERPHRTLTPARPSCLLSKGVSIKGSVKFLNELLIDGEVEGTIDSPGKLSVGEHAQITGEIRAKSVKVRGTVEGNIFATERCELQSGGTLRGDIEVPRLVVDENATFLGSAKVIAAK